MYTVHNGEADFFTVEFGDINGVVVLFVEGAEGVEEVFGEGFFGFSHVEKNLGEVFFEEGEFFWMGGEEGDFLF